MCIGEHRAAACIRIQKRSQPTAIPLFYGPKPDLLPDCFCSQEQGMQHWTYSYKLFMDIQSNAGVSQKKHDTYICIAMLNVRFHLADEL